MKKTLVLILTLSFILLAVLFPVSALSAPRLYDGADLLSESEEKALLTGLNAVSERMKLDAVIVTVDSTGSKSPRDYADDYYDENGYGYGESHDGILLLISMEQRDWYISTCGYGITAFTDAGIDYIGECMVSDLSDGEYADAFARFVELCEEFVTQARSGAPFDVGNLPKEPFDAAMALVIAIVIGFVIGLIVVSVMKGQLKSVRTQSAASNYLKKDSVNLTTSRDFFLFRNVTRVRRETESSGGSGTHRSSSGRSHGGGGGKF